MSKFFQAKAFLQYWLEAVDAHSLHAPFLFDFYTKVIRQKSVLGETENIEALRNGYLRNTQILTLQDPGSGSTVLRGSSRMISAIARTSVSPRKFSLLYNRIIAYTRAQKILELGTSLGINTLYLARGTTQVTTCEGSPEIAQLARKTFAAAGAQNINLVEGNVDTTLPALLQNAGKLDFIFLDANHRYAATLKYFTWLLNHIHDRSILIVDDIHASPEMQDAWDAIRRHSLVYASADLFRCGIVFFDPSLNKQHVVLSF